MYIIKNILPDKWNFESRKYGLRKKNRHAINEVNAFLNYTYSLIESECYRAIQKEGMDDKIGFLHEPTNYKSALVYDLQELFRGIAEKIVFEKIFDKKIFYNDFVRMNDGNVRVRETGIKKILVWCQSELNTSVKYKSKTYSWERMFQLHANQIRNFVNYKNRSLDFSKPIPTLS